MLAKFNIKILVDFANFKDKDSILQTFRKEIMLPTIKKKSDWQYSTNTICGQG